MEEEEQGLSVHSPCQAPPSSASSLPKEQSEVELELKLLEALEIYPPNKLQGIHRHIVLFGLMEFLRRSFDWDFFTEDILMSLDRFYNLDMLIKLGQHLLRTPICWSLWLGGLSSILMDRLHERLGKHTATSFMTPHLINFLCDMIDSHEHLLHTPVCGSPFLIASKS